MKNLLEIGKILRPHGVKGGVKIEKYLEGKYAKFKKVYIAKADDLADVVFVTELNNDSCVFLFSFCHSVEDAEKLRNKLVYIDRNDYPDFKDKVYLADLIHKPVIDEQGVVLGTLEEYDDYGASVILTIKCGVVSYQIPFVEEIICFNKEKDAFITTRQKFEDMKIWE